MDRRMSFEEALEKIRTDPNMQVVLRSLELYDTGLEKEEALIQARLDWWIDRKKPGNGIGPVCKVCDNLIDWAPSDHEPYCTVPGYFGITREPRKPIVPWDDDDFACIRCGCQENVNIDTEVCYCCTNNGKCPHQGEE